MDARILIPLLCIAAVFAAGCTGSPHDLGLLPSPSPPATASPAATSAPADPQACTTGTDCVPAQCCHPTGCVNAIGKQPCNVMCTMSCEGPIDCGAGRCGCVAGRCAVVPASPGSGPAAPATSLRLEASPQRYSPMMSSTPGVRLEVAATGFSPADAQFRWSASFGHFLSWKAPDFTVTVLPSPYLNNGETIYWSFTETPAITKEPVTVRVTATDIKSGAELGTSVLTLDWDGENAVYVGEIR